jgi:hypothetical protein
MYQPQHSHIIPNTHTTALSLSLTHYLCSRHGQLIGIITCNARDTGGATVPRMNFALGVDFILPLVRFAESGDKQYLQPLTTQQNEDMHALWQLQYDGPKPQVWWRDE